MKKIRFTIVSVLAAAFVLLAVLYFAFNYIGKVKVDLGFAGTIRIPGGIVETDLDKNDSAYQAEVRSQMSKYLKSKSSYIDLFDEENGTYVKRRNSWSRIYANDTTVSEYIYTDRQGSEYTEFELTLVGNESTQTYYSSFLSRSQMIRIAKSYKD